MAKFRKFKNKKNSFPDDMAKIKSIQAELIEKIKIDFSIQFDVKFEEGLNLKGFSFENKEQLETFAKAHCECEFNPNTGERVYSVKGVPFFLYKPNTEPLNLNPEKGGYNKAITLAYGEFAFL